MLVRLCSLTHCLVLSFILFAPGFCAPWSTGAFAEGDNPAAAQAPSQSQALPDILNLVGRLLSRSITDKDRLSGVQIDKIVYYDSNLIFSNSISFSEGSTLFFSDNAISDGYIYIVANDLSISGNASITWGRRDGDAPMPPPRGKAPSGTLGRGFGEAGGPGMVGQSGNVGYPGRSAPTLILVVTKIEGGKLSIDLKGENGGQGGTGESGGDGGPGGVGIPGSHSLIDCKQVGGPGGKGGDGGQGGNGGVGGRGGNGGDVFLLDFDKSAKDHFEISNPGGSGGPGGQPGAGGNPGSSGRGGQEARPFCSGGSPGFRGTPGLPGAEGPAGDNGLPGRYFTTEMPLSMVQRLFQ